MGIHNATALIDTGSTATFLTPSFANKAQCPLFPTKKMRVIVANGETLWTEFACFDCKYTIQGIPFTSDFNILQLKGYDTILGADWLYNFSHVTLDYKKMTLQVTTPDHKKVQFIDETLPSSGLMQPSGKLHKLLQQATSGAILFIHHLQPTLPKLTSQA
jgi:predicted aspartyl protease